MNRALFEQILREAADRRGADPHLLRTDPATRFSALVKACCPGPGRPEPQKIVPSPPPTIYGHSIMLRPYAYWKEGVLSLIHI